MNNMIPKSINSLKRRKEIKIDIDATYNHLYN